MLRTEWLEAFIAFAERLNFTHAARALHLSQPALFVQISKLGEAVGVPLYFRQGRQLQLTMLGGASSPLPASSAIATARSSASYAPDEPDRR